MPVFDFNPVSVEQWKIDFFFGLYGRCLDLQDGLVEESFREWQQQIVEYAQQWDEETQERIYESNIDEYTSCEYSQVLFMNSFFVVSYALYEHHRNRIQTAFSVSKLSELNSTTLLETQEWEEIKNYKQIRDKIMHEGGIIPECEEASCYAESKGITGDRLPPRTYVLTRQFCDEALRNFKRFLLNAVTELGEVDSN